MKKLSTIFGLLMLSQLAISQKTEDFKVRTFVKYHPATKADEAPAKPNRYESCSGMQLLEEIEEAPEITMKREYVGLVGADSLILQKRVVNSKKKYVPVDSKILGRTELFGNVRQSNDTLYFYVWPLKGTTASPNEKVFKKPYVMIIPFRTVTSIRYRAFHYGALTLPVKVYLSNRKYIPDNVAFDINLAAMIGVKWGKNKYYHLPNEDKGQTYKKAMSFNYFLGLAKIQVDSTNTTDKIAKSHSLAGVSTGFSLGYQYRKIGIFVALGTDLPCGVSSKRWVFYGQPWLGLGIGLGLD
jgi:hypothetical protein